METITITTPFIKLDALLKFAALCGSGGEAKTLIQEGRVSVNGEVCVQRGRKLVPGNKISLAGAEVLVAHES